MRFITLLILFISLAISAYAAPCYSTKMPIKKEFHTGAQTHVIMNRYLEGSYGEVKSTQHFWLISYGIYDWLSIDLKGGAGNIEQNAENTAMVHYPSSFAGGYGVRFKIFDQDKIKSVFGFQHISVHPKSTHSRERKNWAIVDDWQFSLLVSYDFDFLMPYIGTRWSRVDYIHWYGKDRKRRMSASDQSFGLVLGFDIPINDRSWINLEGQAFDSEAISLSVNYSF